MMSVEQVEGIVKECLDPLTEAYLLQGWKINMSYDREDGGQAAAVVAEAGYRIAWVNIDATALEDRDEVVSVLSHELLHIQQAHIFSYHKAVGKCVSDEVYAALENHFQLAIEENLNSVERMLMGLGRGPKEIIARASKSQKKGTSKCATKEKASKKKATVKATKQPTPPGSISNQRKRSR